VSGKPDDDRMLVRKIEQGTVIDHIPDWKAETVAKVLRIERLQRMRPEISVAILQNVESKTLGRKDIIKIDKWHVDERDADILALVFPSITVNYISDSRVTKYTPRVPETIEERIRCPELRCITNTEREPASTKFSTNKRERLLQCLYCDTLVGFDSVPEQVRT
jgi:aspartate carbamoyltransferase regulatory subunit